MVKDETTAYQLYNLTQTQAGFPIIYQLTVMDAGMPLAGVSVRCIRSERTLNPKPFHLSP